jgi:hypothetical protein
MKMIRMDLHCRRVEFCFVSHKKRQDRIPIRTGLGVMKESMKSFDHTVAHRVVS